MAKKESPVKTAIKAFGEVVSGKIANRVHDEADRLMAKAKHNVLVLEEKLLEKLSIALAMLAAAVFFVVAALFFMLDFLRMTRTHAFLAAAILLLIVAFFLKYRAMRREASR